MNRLHGIGEPRLRNDAGHPSLFIGKGNKGIRFSQRQAHGLLDNDMFPVQKRSLRLPKMVAAWCADHDDIDLVTGKHFFVI